MRGVDVYGWIPEEFWSEIRDHRLSLRKNLGTGRFGLYRYYYADGSGETIFPGSLEECLRRSGEGFIIDGLGLCRSSSHVGINRRRSAHYAPCGEPSHVFSIGALRKSHA